MQKYVFPCVKYFKGGGREDHSKREVAVKKVVDVAREGTTEGVRFQLS